MSQDYPVWDIIQTGFDPKRNLSRETLFSVGNGYMAARAYMDEPYAGDCNTTHRGTYMAGIFDDIPGEPGIYEMCNTPCFFECEIILNGKPLRVTPDNVADWTYALDMKGGVMTRSFVCTAADGKKTRIKSTRFISLDNVHVAAQRIEIVPENWSGPIELHPGIHGKTFNFKFIGKTSVSDPLPIYHFQTLENRALDAGNAALLHVETNTSKMRIAYATQFRLGGSTGEFSADGLSHKFICNGAVKEGEALVFEKVVCVYTSRDCDDERAAALCLLPAVADAGFNGLLENHKDAWAKKWEQIDVLIDGPDLDQQAVRFNMFQLIQSNSEHDPKVNIPPRGLFGERYRGNAFWDTESYMLPFFELTNPQAAANLLSYRYHGLDGARAKAKKYLFNGAMFPWMSCHDGTEQCLDKDFAFYEIHITADVAFGVWHYWMTTGDDAFMVRQGAELLIETARFWASRVSWSAQKQQYVIMHVIGPDEFCGRNGNNTFTNRMAVQNFKAALDAIELLRAKDAWSTLKAKIGFDETEADQWREIIEKMYVHYRTDQKLYMQDDDFDDLPELDVMPYRAMGGAGQESIPHPCWEMHKVVKQADVILLMVLLSDDFTLEEKKAAWEYYEHRTLHSSSLSYAIHSILAAELGLEEIAIDYYRRSARLDIDDTHNNTGHGLHTPAAGGSWQVVIAGFGGLRVLEDRLVLCPKLPSIWNGLRFKVCYRGWTLSVHIQKGKTAVQAEGNGMRGAVLELNGKRFEIMADTWMDG
jgi:kojibiose phosphorylase